MSCETSKKCCIPNVEHHPELATETVFALPEEVLAEEPEPIEPVFGVLATTLDGPSPGQTTKAWNAAYAVDSKPQLEGLEKTKLIAAIDRQIRDHVLSDRQKKRMEELEERAWKEKEAGMMKQGFATKNEEANERLKHQINAIKRMEQDARAGQVTPLGVGLGIIGAAKAASPVPTAGMKHDGGKPPVSLVPQALTYGAARAYGFGEKKYGRFNYRLGIKASRLLDAAARHLSEVAEGKTVDEESGLHPLDHAAAALGMLMDTLERVKQGKIDASFNDLYIEQAAAVEGLKSRLESYVTAKYAQPPKIG